MNIYMYMLAASKAFKFNKFHYKDKLSFFRAQARDRDKKEWCVLNEIKIIVFNYNETEEEWKNKL